MFVLAERPLKVQMPKDKATILSRSFTIYGVVF